MLQMPKKTRKKDSYTWHMVHHSTMDTCLIFLINTCQLTMFRGIQKKFLSYESRNFWRALSTIISDFKEKIQPNMFYVLVNCKCPENTNGTFCNYDNYSNYSKHYTNKRPTDKKWSINSINTTVTKSPR